MASVISVNVGLPRNVESHGKMVRTGIFKEPVSGRVPIRKLNLDGDRQADLSVHGGPDKAVYAYPSEHYAYWRKELPGVVLPWGAFGENLTTEGLNEHELHIGDRLRVGSAEVTVTQPRLPCYKLGIRFGRRDMVRRFQNSGRSGFYFSVSKEGAVAAGDEILVFPATDSDVTVADIVRLYLAAEPEPDLLRRATELSALPESWREYFRERLDG